MNAKQISSATTAQLVAFYNGHAAQPVKKFSDRKTAERRVAAVVNSLCASLRRASDERRAEQQSDSRSLVVLKSAALGKQFGAFAYGKPKSSSVSAPSAYGRGREDGRAVDVARRAVGASAASPARQIA